MPHIPAVAQNCTADLQTWAAIRIHTQSKPWGTVQALARIGT